DFALGPLLPVLFGEGVQRKRRNMDGGGRFHRRTHRSYARAMSGNTRHVTTARPAPVAVHNDGDVFWEPSRIQVPVKVCFLAIQPGGNRSLQRYPLLIQDANIRSAI